MPAVDFIKALMTKDFNPDEPRDESGKWTTGGASGAPKPAGPTGGKLADRMFAANKNIPPKMGINETAAKATLEERQAVSGYKDGKYREMNKYLALKSLGKDVSHLPGWVQDRVKAMDEAIERLGTVLKEGLLYRGISSPEVKAKDWKAAIGTNIDWPGFTSASKDYSFSKMSKSWAGSGTLFRIYTHAGTKALDYEMFKNHPNGSDNLKNEGYTYNDSEHEVILNRGSKFYVKDAKVMPNGSWQVDLILNRRSKRQQYD